MTALSGAWPFDEELLLLLVVVVVVLFLMVITASMMRESRSGSDGSGMYSRNVSLFFLAFFLFFFKSCIYIEREMERGLFKRLLHRGAIFIIYFLLLYIYIFWSTLNRDETLAHRRNATSSRERRERGRKQNLVTQEIYIYMNLYNSTPFPERSVSRRDVKWRPSRRVSGVSASQCCSIRCAEVSSQSTRLRRVVCRMRIDLGRGEEMATDETMTTRQGRGRHVST